MGYKIHHLNTATLCPGAQKFVEGKGSLLKKGKLSCHCLLIETNDGLVLVDTGFGLDDIQKPGLIDRFTLKSLGAKADPKECAVSQIKSLGYKPEDVRHIVLTHLDADHAGGIKDFPHAEVHIHTKELVAGNQPLTLYEKVRYQQKHWRHKPNWKAHEVVGERWFGFGSVSVLSDALYDILLIPLHGHSRGHCGVAVSTTEGWLLHCGDAYFSSQEIKSKSASCPPLLNIVQTMDDSSRADRLYNQVRLRTLYQNESPGIRLVCSHDHSEYECCCSYTAMLGRNKMLGRNEG